MSVEAPHSAERVGEVQAKLDAVRDWLRRHDLEGVVIGTQAGFAWITGGGDSHVSLGEATGAASVMVTGADAVVISANIERARLADEELRDLPFTQAEFPWHRPGSGRELVAELADPERVAADADLWGLSPAPADMVELRYTLGPAEVARYRALGLDAAEAAEAAIREAGPGDQELEVAARLASECRRRGILPLVVLVAADHRVARYRHPIPTSNRVRGTLLVALTGRRHGLHASVTRMRALGRAEPELLRRQASSARVDARAIGASRPGRSLGRVFEEIQEQYSDEGSAEEWRLHHQGGLTGYAGREIFAVPGEPHVLAANQVVAWNPSITGAKSEDTALVTEGGPEVLTRTGTWPEITAESEEGAVARPAMLEGGTS
jgi:Xaa-Pro aminopeptidase